VIVCDEEEFWEILLALFGFVGGLLGLVISLVLDLPLRHVMCALHWVWVGVGVRVLSCDVLMALNWRRHMYIVGLLFAMSPASMSFARSVRSLGVAYEYVKSILSIT
jgi:hypothetical protein